METDEPRESVKDWMNAKEMADWLGVSERVLSSNRLPNANVGGRRFYNIYDVAAWLRKRQERDS